MAGRARVAARVAARDAAALGRGRVGDRRRAAHLLWRQPLGRLELALGALPRGGDDDLELALRVCAGHLDLDALVPVLVLVALLLSKERGVVHVRIRRPCRAGRGARGRLHGRLVVGGGVVLAQEIVEVDCARVALVPVVQHADRAPPPRQVGQVVAHAALPVLALDQLVRARVLALQLLALGRVVQQVLVCGLDRVPDLAVGNRVCEAVRLERAQRRKAPVVNEASAAVALLLLGRRRGRDHVLVVVVAARAERALRLPRAVEHGAVLAPGRAGKERRLEEAAHARKRPRDVEELHHDPHDAHVLMGRVDGLLLADGNLLAQHGHDPHFVVGVHPSECLLARRELEHALDELLARVSGLPPLGHLVVGAVPLDRDPAALGGQHLHGQARVVRGRGRRKPQDLLRLRRAVVVGILHHVRHGAQHLALAVLVDPGAENGHCAADHAHAHDLERSVEAALLGRLCPVLRAERAEHALAIQRAQKAQQRADVRSAQHALLRVFRRRQLHEQWVRRAVRIQPRVPRLVVALPDVEQRKQQLLAKGRAHELARHRGGRPVTVLNERGEQLVRADARALALLFALLDLLLQRIALRIGELASRHAPRVGHLVGGLGLLGLLARRNGRVHLGQVLPLLPVGGGPPHPKGLPRLLQLVGELPVLLELELQLVVPAAAGIELLQALLAPIVVGTGLLRVVSAQPLKLPELPRAHGVRRRAVLHAQLARECLFAAVHANEPLATGGAPHPVPARARAQARAQVQADLVLVVNALQADAALGALVDGVGGAGHEAAAGRAHGHALHRNRLLARPEVGCADLLVLENHVLELGGLRGAAVVCVARRPEADGVQEGQHVAILVRLVRHALPVQCPRKVARVGARDRGDEEGHVCARRSDRNAVRALAGPRDGREGARVVRNPHGLFLGQVLEPREQVDQLLVLGRRARRAVALVLAERRGARARHLVALVKREQGPAGDAALLALRLCVDQVNEGHRLLERALAPRKHDRAALHRDTDGLVEVLHGLQQHARHAVGKGVVGVGRVGHELEVLNLLGLVLRRIRLVGFGGGRFLARVRVALFAARLGGHLGAAGRLGDAVLELLRPRHHDGDDHAEGLVAHLVVVVDLPHDGRLQRLDVGLAALDVAVDDDQVVGARRAAAHLLCDLLGRSGGLLPLVSLVLARGLGHVVDHLLRVNHLVHVGAQVSVPGQNAPEHLLAPLALPRGRQLGRARLQSRRGSALRRRGGGRGGGQGGSRFGRGLVDHGGGLRRGGGRGATLPLCLEVLELVLHKRRQRGVVPHRAEHLGERIVQLVRCHVL